MRIHPQLVPPGGWKFQHGQITLQDDSFNALVELVKSHRRSNKLPPGDPEQELHEQIGTKYPKLVIKK